MPVDLSSYVSVGERIVAFREKYPEGSLQPADPFNPFQIVEIGELTFVAYTAAAYRSADDPRPGIGVAWEPFPGKTNFTRDSELQNAETSAWGRAIVAALAADTQRGIASIEEIQGRDDSNAEPVASADTLRSLRDGLRVLGSYPEAYKAAGYPPLARLDEMLGGTIRPMPAQAAHQALELLREIATAEAATGDGADPDAPTSAEDSPSAVAHPWAATTAATDETLLPNGVPVPTPEPAALAAESTGAEREAGFAQAGLSVGLALADASALASAPCYLCGSTGANRVLDAHNRVRCAIVANCEKRQRDLDHDDAASNERDLQLGEAVE